MAQISHECMGGQIIREDMMYKPQRIMQIFGVGKHSAKVTEAEAVELAGQPYQLAERVYGRGNPKKAKELGNIKAGDGYKYRGGGMLQLTGAANYKSCGALTGYNLFNYPDQLDEPVISFKVAVAEFIALGCLIPARKDDVLGVTIKINGGRNGLAERTVWLRKWKEALGSIDEQFPKPRFAETDAPPSFLGTHTGKISAVTGVAGIGSTVAQVSQYASTVGDGVRVVQENGVQVVEAVRVVRPLLGLSHETWAALGIGLTVAVIIGVVTIGIYRYIKIKTEAS